MPRTQLEISFGGIWQNTITFILKHAFKCHLQNDAILFSYQWIKHDNVVTWKTLSALPVLCERNPTWSVDSLHKGPIVPGSNVAFVVCLNKLFNKRWYCQWCHRAHVTPCTVMMFLFSFLFQAAMFCFHCPPALHPAARLGMDFAHCPPNPCK